MNNWNYETRCLVAAALAACVDATSTLVLNLAASTVLSCRQLNFVINIEDYEIKVEKSNETITLKPSAVNASPIIVVDIVDNIIRFYENEY